MLGKLLDVASSEESMGVKVTTFITIGDKIDPVTGEKISEGYQRSLASTF
jgi:hypothetical protein